MENADFEKLKRRIKFITWILFIFAVLPYLIYKFQDPSFQIPVSFYILTPILLIFNIALSIDKVSEKINSYIFFVIFILYTGMLAVLIIQSGSISIGEESFSPPYFLVFFLPIIYASYSYGMQGAFIMSIIITAIDFGMSYYFREQGLTEFNPPNIIINLVIYILIAFFISYTEEDKKQAEQDKKKREDEFKKLINKLQVTNKDLESRYKTLEKEQMMASMEVKKRSHLLELSKTLTKDLELTAALTTTLKKIREMLLFNSAAAFLYNSDKSELIITAHEGLYEEEMKMSLRADIAIPYIVAETGKPLNIPRTSDDPRFKAIMSTAKVKSAAYVPIELDKEIFGIIALWKMEEEGYNEEDIVLLQTITREAARSIKNAVLHRKLKTEKTFIEALWDASQRLTSTLDLSSAWERILEEVLKDTGNLFNADKLIFFQFKEEMRELTPHIGVNVSDGTKQNLIIKVKQDPLVLSDFLRSKFQVKDLRNDSRYGMIAPFAVKEELSSMIWYPVMGSHQIIGALAMFSTQRRIWSSEEIKWLDIFIKVFTMTLDNVRLLTDLVSEKSRLQTLIDNVPEGVYTTDSNRIIQTWNKAAEKITGFKMSEVLGKDCCNYIKCQNIEEVFCETRCPIKQAMDKLEKVDSGLESVFVLNSKDEQVPAFITAAPILNEEGNISGTILVFRDITKEKEIERMKEEFLATITHDLKSPLASIMGYTELLLNPKLGDITQNQKEFLDAILRSSKTLQILINNILESTRMEAGKMTYNFVLFKMDDLVGEIEEMFRPLLAHKSLKFKANVDKSTVVYGDREKIREIFINLVSNALKFTPENGLITISGYKTNGKVEIRVSDTGKGIPEDSISKLFQKFAQVKGEKRGTGLGLYICKKILEAHNQNIRVESTLGQGTTFIFTLDSQQPAEEGKDELSVLIIEKDEPLAKMMERYFLEQSFQVKLASSLDNTKKVLESGSLPSVVIIDWHLDGNEAVEIMDYVRSDEKTEDLPILLLCDYREDIRGDFDAVVNKPINFKDLLMKANAFADV